MEIWCQMDYLCWAIQFTFVLVYFAYHKHILLSISIMFVPKFEYKLSRWSFTEDITNFAYWKQMTTFYYYELCYHQSLNSSAVVLNLQFYFWNVSHYSIPNCLDSFGYFKHIWIISSPQELVLVVIHVLGSHSVVRVHCIL